MRPRIDLKLYEGSTRLLTVSKRLRTRIIAIAQEHEWDYGTVRVWYSIEHDMWNEGTFTTIAGLRQLLIDFHEVEGFDTPAEVQAALN